MPKYFRGIFIGKRFLSNRVILSGLFLAIYVFKHLLKVFFGKS